MRTLFIHECIIYELIWVRSVGEEEKEFEKAVSRETRRNKSKSNSKINKWDRNDDRLQGVKTNNNKN